MTHNLRLTFLVSLVLLAALAGCTGGEPAALEAGEALPGGDTTVHETSANAFSLSARNLPLAEKAPFFVGNSFFNRNWVVAPSSTTGIDGLGPVFNATSCSDCHFRDGRGRPPLVPDDPFVSILVRLSVPGAAADEAPRPDPVYGGQLQEHGIPGVPAEGRARLEWDEVPGAYDDGEGYSLRRPRLSLDLALGEASAALATSVRVAPAVFGLGLLEAIPEEDLLARADPDDADGDGISGRANVVPDVITGLPAVGRFGWKANQPSVAQQVAGAFLGDIGITSGPFPEQECTTAETECGDAASGGEPELAAGTFADIVFYQRVLAVPARRAPDDAVTLRGREIFRAIGCADCHAPRHTTRPDVDIAALAGQTIFPYTDLLLHDMGDDLADGRADYGASGTEWKTPPLWGLGLVPVVNRHELLLHDGRARGFAEAILWHGGEAEAAREAFRSLSAAERAALVQFLESL